MESKVLIQTMKSFLKAQGITYKDLSKKMNLSEVTIKRSFSSGGFTLDRFLRICEIANIDFKKLVNTCQEDTEDQSHEYTLEQEYFFAKYPKYLSYFDLLIKYGAIKAANKHSSLTKKEIEHCLLKLDKLSLIEYHPQNKIKFTVGRNMKWRLNGPLRKKLLPKAKSEFLNSTFDHKNSHLSFLLLDLTPHHIEKLNAQIRTLLKKVTNDSNIDRILKKKQTELDFSWPQGPGISLL